MKLAEVIGFDGLVQYGKESGADIINGMPWSFTYKGHSVTHENDQCYLIGVNAEPFTPDHILIVTASGKLLFLRA